jgi:hypothetical protein
MLLDEILKRRSLEIKADHQQREIQAVEQGERAQLSLLEEKVKEVLTMLRSLNSMVNKTSMSTKEFLYVDRLL